MSKARKAAFILLLTSPVFAHAQPDIVARPDLYEYRQLLKRWHVKSVEVDLYENGKNAMLFDRQGRQWALVHMGPLGDTLYINYFGYDDGHKVISFDTYSGHSLLPGNCYTYEYNETGLCTLIVRHHPVDAARRDSSFIVYDKWKHPLIDPSGQLYEYAYGRDSMPIKVHHHSPDQDSGEYYTMQYDLQNRLLQKRSHLPDGSEEVELFGYDDKGRMDFSMTNNEVTGWSMRNAYFYNEAGLPECIQIYSGDNWMNEYTYQYAYFRKHRKRK